MNHMKSLIQITSLVLISTFLSTINLHAKNYYLSNQGNDKNSGETPAGAWQSIEFLNSQNLKAGDTVFFQRNGKFFGSIVAKYSGKEKNPIVYTAYGKGEKPVIKGSRIISGFNKTGDNLYEASFDQSFTLLFDKHKTLINARYPNTGYRAMQGGGTDFFIDENLELNKNVVENSTVCLRPLNWLIHTREIIDVENGKFRLNDNLFLNKSCNPGWGYYLQNKMEYLDYDNEYYFNKDKQLVTLYSSDSLSEDYSVEATILDHGFRIAKTISNIEITGLEFCGYSKNGIQLERNNSHIKISDCIINKIYLIGIRMDLHCNNVTIRDNDITNVYGRGISALEVSNCTITHNTIQNIGLIPGYGIDGLNGGTGISLTSREDDTLKDRKISSNNLLSYNFIDSIGYNGIRIDGNNSICEYNIVKNGMLTLNDGALIYCWGSFGDPDFTKDNIIRGNIVRFAKGNVEGTPSDHKMVMGIYIDNRANHISVLDNIVTDIYTGIHVNDGSYNNLIKGNVIFGNKKGLSFAEFAKDNGAVCENNIAINNIIFNTFNIKHTLVLKHTYQDHFIPGEIDSNIYASPNEVFHIKYETMESGYKNIKEYTFKSWQKRNIMDINSKFIEINKEDKYEIFINESMCKEKTITLKKGISHKDIYGNSVNDTIKLPPLSSKILIYKL